MKMRYSNKESNQLRRGGRKTQKKKPNDKDVKIEELGRKPHTGNTSSIRLLSIMVD